MSWFHHNEFCDAHSAEHRECHHSGTDQHGHCTFDIWAPDRHTSVNNLAFSAYAYHQQQIEDFVQALSLVSDPNDPDAQYEVAQCVGLDPNTLTADEIEYIEREVAKRW